MTEILKVNKEVLDAEALNLESLYNSTDLNTKIAALQNFSVSRGDSVGAIRDFNAELISLNDAMKQLYGNTLHFLKNAHSNFVTADEQ